MKKHLIVDIDGTIADLSHRLHHINGSSRKDWDAFFAACKYDRVHVDVVTIIKDLAAQNMTMVIVTHAMQFARDVADRVVFMDGGRIVEEGPAEHVIDHPREQRTREFLSRIEG